MLTITQPIKAVIKDDTAFQELGIYEGDILPVVDTVEEIKGEFCFVVEYAPEQYLAFKSNAPASEVEFIYE